MHRFDDLVLRASLDDRAASSDMIVEIGGVEPSHIAPPWSAVLEGVTAGGEP